MVPKISFLIFVTFLSLVVVEGRKGFGGTEQEWSYETVRPKAHMFWWLYYTTSKSVADVHDKPLLIWLQGGPGASSTGYGNFQEIGPLDMDLKPRNLTWVNDYNVLFIDNPIGTGYSYSETDSGFAENNTQIAADLLECIKGFYKKEPKWLNVPTYIAAESYGGKMAVEFSFIWKEAQKSGNLKSDFRGILFIDSFISSTETLLGWAPYLLATGMIDTNGFGEIAKAATKANEALEAGQFNLSLKLMLDIISLICRLTGNINIYNILYEARVLESSKTKLNLPYTCSEDEESDLSLRQLMNGEVKEALNLHYVNVTWGSQKDNVFQSLAGDLTRSVTDQVERLLNETDLEVFVINGQLDLIVSTPGTLKWVENLKWKYSKDWRNASRDPLVVDNIIEGYVKQYKQLKMYWVNRSGHMVPADNPVATLAILKHLTANAFKN